MPANLIPIGAPAHDAEAQAIRFLVDGLPATYTVFANPWLVERTGLIHELDAVVVAPHAIFIVEIKSYRGRIEGTDNDWWTPEKIRSPLKVNRLTAQMLKSQLRNASFDAGQVWVEGFVFLSATLDVGVAGPASKDRVHTRRTILDALTDPALIGRLSQGRASQPASFAERDLLNLLAGVRDGPRPTRRVREYDVLTTLEHGDGYTELLGRNNLSGDERVLRIYGIPPLSSEAARERVAARARWEAQVLGRLGRIDGILSADPPFADEAGIVLPLEHFRGITLTTWVERYGPDAPASTRADFRARTDLWLRIAATIEDAHRQGVVHRLLRPDVILVEDHQTPTQVRITGFDLAKQLSADTTVLLTTLADDRLQFAAPEVVTSFSSAEPASDQFSLGAILGLLLTGRPLFDSTRQLILARSLTRRVRDAAQRIPLTIDEAVSRMLALRPPDRYPSLADALSAIRAGREPDARPLLPGLAPTRSTPLDPDDLAVGTRLGSDYEITGRLGQGGMSVVYAARHLVSGRTRALKIARPETASEDALRGEYQVLATLDHPNIVRVQDLSKMVDGRLTLVMERVGGQTLRNWLTADLPRDPNSLRRLAEDLLAGLAYLSQQNVTHKDLKPDNLIVDDGHLTLIDFSLAGLPDDAPYGGTALYRDPSSARWTFATDLYAAALCLFELYAGRHAFDGHVPEPLVEPQIREEDIAPAGLAPFFRRALSPDPARRFPHVHAFRDALLLALGEDAPAPAAPAPQLDISTPLRLTGLSRRAQNALSRCQVQHLGDLLALSPAQIRAIHAIGTKTATEILALQDALRTRGLASSSPGPGTAAASAEPPLLPDLATSTDPISVLPVSDGLRTALLDVGLTTVGAVAALSRPALLALPGFGLRRLADIVDALHTLRDRTTSAAHAPATLDRLWNAAARALSESQRVALERCIGLSGAPETQSLVADALGKTQSQVSRDVSAALEHLDMAPLHRPLEALDGLLQGFGGIARLSDLGDRFAAEWSPGAVTGAGMVRLLVRLSGGRTHLLEVDAADEPVLALPTFDRDLLRAFTAEVLRLASQWPPIEPDSARRTLSALLPDFSGDPLALGVRLCGDVSVAETGHLFVGPLDPRQTLRFVLDQVRGPVDLEALAAQVRRTFGPATPFPDADHLLSVLREMDYQIQGDRVLPGRTSSLLAPAALTPDASPAAILAQERPPEVVIRDMLRDAAHTRGFRMLVAPPEQHVEIARSVATALGGTWLSFDDAFFADHGDDLPALERAERFIAQRDALTEAAELTLFRLLDTHGTPGRTLVLGDTALLGLCEALDLPRRLYDETLSGNRGFWILVLPGVIHNRQPRFNEAAPMWHLEGATLPLLSPIPAS
jgi:serine/threonine protein kinase